MSLARRRLLVSSAVLFALSVATAYGVALTFDAFKVPGESMLPTFGRGDRVITRGIAGEDVERGDIVVFESPEPHHLTGESVTVVARAVALPSDDIEFDDGRVILNGRPLDEEYVSPGTETRGGLVVRGEGIFVMGDNRENSADSRVYGRVPLSNFRARVVATNVPVDWIAIGVALLMGLLLAGTAVAPRLRRQAGNERAMWHDASRDA